MKPEVFEVVAFDRDSRPVRRVVGSTTAPPSALAIDPDGGKLAIGDESGRVRVVDVQSGEVGFDRPDVGGEVKAIAFGPGGRLAIGTGKGMVVASVDRPVVEPVVGIEGTVDTVAFSADGRWLSALAQSGEVAAWKVEPGRPPTPLNLERPASETAIPTTACLAFGPSTVAPMLVVGEVDGGLRRWTLDPIRAFAPFPRTGAGSSGSRPTPRASGCSRSPRTGSPRSGTWKGDARSGPSTGLWTSGAFLPDGRLVLAVDPGVGRGLVVVDPRTGRAGPENFPRPEGPDAGKPAPLYDRVVASRDGRWVAALQQSDPVESTHVWDLNDGRRARNFADAKHPSGVKSVDFSADGRTLLTAVAEGHIALWDLAGPGPAPEPVARYHALGIEDLVAAAVSVAPGGRRRVVAAGWSTKDFGHTSSVVYWDGQPGPKGEVAAPRSLGELDGQATDVTFLGDGRYAAASGAGKKIRFWDLGESSDPKGKPSNLQPSSMSLTPDFHHDEEVADLLSWPKAGRDGPILVSGARDTTVRFWKLVPGPNKQSTYELMGTLAAAPERFKARAGGPPGDGFGPDAPWVAFTPEGLYDGSLDGDRMVSFADGRALIPADQFASRLFRPLLTDKIRIGEPGRPEPFVRPKPLLIEAPRTAPRPWPTSPSRSRSASRAGGSSTSGSTRTTCR